MSRARRFIRNVASGYLLLFASMLYVLASVPLALKFLTKEEFGLWALMTQISGYLALIDLGTSPSVSRLLIDCKDRPDDGDYGSLIQTGGLVLTCQGFIILLVGVLASPLASHLLQIPSHLEGPFIYLMRWQSAILAVGFVTRVFGHVLYGHQKSDYINYVQAILSVANLLVLWVAFLAGVGTYSILWVSATSCVVTSITYVGFCVKLRLLPKKGRWGVPSWARFRELFSYGKDVFLISLGRQLTVASQTLVISRSLGLGAVAAWSVGTRILNLLLQLISRIFDFAEPIFAEMVVRGERDNLRERFRSTTTLGASLSGVAAVLFALCSAGVLSGTARRISSDCGGVHSLQPRLQLSAWPAAHGFLSRVFHAGNRGGLAGPDGKDRSFPCPRGIAGRLGISAANNFPQASRCRSSCGRLRQLLAVALWDSRQPEGGCRQARSKAGFALAGQSDRCSPDTRAIRVILYACQPTGQQASAQFEIVS